MAIGIVKQTKLWGILISKITSHEDVSIIEKACEEAEDLLSRIPDTFPTYTLHDGRHCINICNLMFELLGNRISQLTNMEVVFLILSAFYHDTGMVYTSDEKIHLLDSQSFVEFRKTHQYADDKIKENNGQVPDDIAEWFFRSIHPNRMGYIPDLIIEGSSIKHELVSLCKSHGSNTAEILNNDSYRELIEYPQESADLVFCAVLLRLADILDFDQSRAPEVLYEYLKLKDANTIKYETSKKEFLKHKGALGFTFPKERQGDYKIRFNAQCESIEIEHDIRSFLIVIEKEFRECANLLSKYKTKWDNVLLPSGIDIKESYGRNYQYGQYLFTVEHEKALKLFVGEGLYSDKTVFVRELIQNAIDTVLHRLLYEKYHHELSYNPEIHITTWTDENHYQWIRIDDNGMGMDERKIRDYFLKAAESYYTSVEFADDISLYSKKKIGKFSPISRFGIGVLSCFLAGDRIEVSTRTHNNKAVRLSMKKGEKYFTTQLEKKEHKANPMPMRSNENTVGYRKMPGTSIAVRVEPYQHFDELNFEDIVKNNILYPPIPIYLNDKKFITEDEFLSDVDKTNENIYKFPIPESSIVELKQAFRITIHPDAYIMIGVLNLSNYVSKQNAESLKGALFLLDSKFMYTDDFYEKHQNYFKHESLIKATIKVFIENHRVKMLVDRSSYLIEKSNIPVDELNWVLEMHGYHKNAYIDLNIDMSFIEKDNTYLTHLCDKTRLYYEKGNSWLMQHYSHNGIVYLSGALESYQNDLYEHLLVVLCREKYRPELSVSRSNVQSLPLEMLSEVYLAIRKAFNKFDRQLKYDLNRGFYPDFMPRGVYFLQYRFSSITAKEICEFSNFESNEGDSWCDYFNAHFSEELYGDKPIFLAMESLADIILATWLQKHKQCNLIKQQDGKYSFVINSLKKEYDDIIYRYYPPLFFLPVDGDHSLIVRYTYKKDNDGYLNARCFVNINNQDAEKMINITGNLHNQYPALFKAFVKAVLSGNKDTVNDFIYKIKSLPLWKNM